jgi:hypothetical protein
MTVADPETTAVRVTVRIDYADGHAADITATEVGPVTLGLSEADPPDITGELARLARRPPPRVLTIEVAAYLFTVRPDVAAAEAAR